MEIDVLIPVAVSMLVALSLLHFMLRHAFFGKAIDIPNERSLHTIPVPRTGGLGLMAGVLAGWLFAWQPWLWPLLFCLVLLVLISFLDDLYGLSAGWRFLAHFGVACAFIGVVALRDMDWYFAIILVVAIVWMINLYNFMDGSDGLAGGMALSGFGFYALAAWLSADAELVAVALTVAGGAAAFLVFNFHPAKIFMGDAGSVPLGFLAAAVGLVGWQRDCWPLWFPILVFSPFIVDSTVTLLKRLFRGEKVWQAHRNHYYQRLVQMGWGHRRTAICEYGLMLLVGVSAIAMLGKPLVVQLAGMTFWFLAYAALTFTISRMWKRAAIQ